MHLSVKRVGQAPGDVTDAQLEAIADMADRFSCGELRVTHDQNALLPFVREEDLFAVWQAAKANTLAAANIGLLSDMIACPGGDFCALANARSIPIANELIERYQDLDELYDIGEIDLHISGCINSCGHHHTGHIGILASTRMAPSGIRSPWRLRRLQPRAHQRSRQGHWPIVCSRRSQRRDRGHRSKPTAANARQRKFIDTVKRVGIDPKSAANAVRRTTAKASPIGRKGLGTEIHRHPSRPVAQSSAAKTARCPPPIKSYSLLTWAQWHAVREQWPAQGLRRLQACGRDPAQ